MILFLSFSVALKLNKQNRMEYYVSYMFFTHIYPSIKPIKVEWMTKKTTDMGKKQVKSALKTRLRIISSNRISKHVHNVSLHSLCTSDKIVLKFMFTYKLCCECIYICVYKLVGC